MNQTANWIVPFLSELVIDMFLCLVSTWISNVICNIYVSKKHVALKTNILASSYDIMCFCRTWILWRPFPYWLWEWDKGYIYIISWLEQGCCFCEQLQHWKILAGKILCILFFYLFMNSSYIYFLVINLCFAHFSWNWTVSFSGTWTTVCPLCSRANPQTWRQRHCMYFICSYGDTLFGYDFFFCFCCTFSENSGK